MPGYVYKGTSTEHCGTTWGYQLHLRAKTLACKRCLAAQAHASQQWRAKQPGYKTYQPCGTYGAAKRHYKNGEKPCEPCHAALLAYRREQQAKKRKEVN